MADKSTGSKNEEGLSKIYTGEALKNEKPDYDQNGNPSGETIPPYIPGKQLIETVRYARLLKRPLLIRGEPGCGKTRLAQAIAYELYGAKYRNYFFEWYIKSTEKAKDGLYTYDHLARLRDVQSTFGVFKTSKEKYISYGPMGEAFQTDRPAILLIDEIDKANIDFPNDLLLELDQKRFEVKELDNMEVKAVHAPIVIITSNDERALPNAFLRRCVFHNITMTKSNWLEIVTAHFSQGENQISEVTLQAIVDRFDLLVTAMKNGNASKKPDTSELLDWVHTIHHFWLKGKVLNNEDIKKELNGDTLLYAEILLKTLEDRLQYSTIK